MKLGGGFAAQEDGSGIDEGLARGAVFLGALSGSAPVEHAT